MEGDLGGVRLVRNASRALSSGGTELSLLLPWLLIVLAGRGSLIWCFVIGGTRASSVAGVTATSLPMSRNSDAEEKRVGSLLCLKKSWW